MNVVSLETFVCYDVNKKKCIKMADFITRNMVIVFSKVL